MAETAKIVREFTIWLLAATALYLLVDFALGLVIDVSIPGHMANTMILWGCAMIAGDRYYKRSGQVPDKAFSWKIGFWFLGVNLAFTTISTIGLLVALNWSQSGDWAYFSVVTEYLLIVLVLFLFVTLVNLLVSRFGFSFGAKSAKKYMDKKPLKGAS